MALETDIAELRFTTGQDEGTERAVLPAGQFSYLQNTRFRKNQRLGKRNGYTSVSSLDASGAPLGTGGGRLTCLGPNFCAVDNKFYQRNDVAGEWRLPNIEIGTGARANGRIVGDFPEWVPQSAFEPVPLQSALDLGSLSGTALPVIGAMTTAQGYIWTGGAFYSTARVGWVIRVRALDPLTRRTVFQQEFLETSGTAATQQHAILLSTGNGTVVLIYDHFTAGTKDGIRVRALTDIDVGFGSESSLACLVSGANYCTGHATEFLLVYATSAVSYTVARVNPSTLVASDSYTQAVTGPGNPTLLSCFGYATSTTWVGFTDQAASGGLRVRTYGATLASGPTGTSATYGAVFAVNTDPRGPILFAPRSASVVTTVARCDDGGFVALDLTSTAASSPVGSSLDNMLQGNCSPISQPFAVDGKVYIWAVHEADSQLGVATLLRIPLASEFGANGVSPYLRSFPIEGVIDDRDIDEPVAPAASGPTFPQPVLTSLGYTALISFTRDSIAAATPYLNRRMLLAPAKHRSQGVRYAPSCVVPAAGKLFVAGAQPMWVDAAGAYEAGFNQAPVSAAAPIVTAGGSLEAESLYSYTAIFETLDSNGLIERSAPATPVEATTTTNTTVTVSFTTLELSHRDEVRCKVYRTLANAAVFQYCGLAEATPTLAGAGNSGLRAFTFVDTTADSYVTQNETLYTQVGQELPASQFPSCAFANVGGNRLWCAGGFNGSVAHASKLFVPRVCPEFADDDAFRVSLPADITGSAWCDNQVLFTQEGIHVVSGDGPDGAGVGFFTTSRLPFNIGCIDWRSVVATDIGVFFQSARGLYLLPRGFGQPIAMDQVLDTLTAYPIITSARASYDSQGGADNSEHVVQWTAVADEAATSGVVITFDLAYKAFSVDTFSADFPATFQAGWSGESVLAPGTTTVGGSGAGSWHPFRVRDGGYDDEGLTIAMRAVTGDVRPWGLFSHGVVNRVGLLGQLRSACTVSVEKVSDRGTGNTASRVYTAAGTASEPAAGTDIYLDVELGNAEQRDITSLRVAIAETSAVEGVALFGMVLESDKKPQGFRLQGPADRVT